MKKEIINEIVKSIKMYHEKMMGDINFYLRIKYDNKDYISDVISWTDDCLIFSSPMNGTDFVHINIGSEIDAFFISQGAFCSSKLKIDDINFAEGMLHYKSKIVSPLIKQEARDAFRVHATVDVTLKLMERVKEDKPPLIVGEGYTRNISIGGMLFSTHEKLIPGDIIRLSFEFMEAQFNVSGKILLGGVPTADNINSYRVQFLDLLRDDQNSLNRVIFQKQRELLKNRKL